MAILLLGSFAALPLRGTATGTCTSIVHTFGSCLPPHIFRTVTAFCMLPPRMRAGVRTRTPAAFAIINRSHTV